MKMSKLYMPTLREVPTEAELQSHQLLLRAGMIRKLVSGVYSYLPLGYKVIRKVEQIVREEMNNAGSQEALLSAVQPREIWDQSGRWEDFGPEMWKLKDRHEREFCLGPTHEEYFTSLLKDEIKSYKQLPLNIYQIQTKYRDEKRPRFGLIRSREFIMKDAYSFNTDYEGSENSYQEMWDAYDRVFKRLNLEYRVVQGDTGAMGGKVSHEFMAISEVGEGLISYCNKCDYAASDEKAQVVYKMDQSHDENQELEKVHTPDVRTIDALVEFFNIDKSKFGKALIYKAGSQPVVAIIPGNRELNETKLVNYLKIQGHELELADESIIKEISGADKGYTGPIGLKEGTRILVDSRIKGMKNLIVGGNESNYHYKNANYGRDFEGEIVDDLLMIKEGDLCPDCEETLGLERGIEVGNIFQLGTKYSESLGATYLDQNGKEQNIVMGSYGIGVTRSVAAVVEQFHDENGIKWPLAIAPYHVIVSIINVKNEEQLNLGKELYERFISLGIEVLLDDRNERAGVKFKDRDLIGIPLRITVGKLAGEGIVEYSTRESVDKEEISVDDAVENILSALREAKVNSL